MVCIVMSMRRFWRADHPKRWWYGALGGTVLVFLVVLAVQDFAQHRLTLIVPRLSGCSARSVRGTLRAMALVCLCHGVNERRVRREIEHGASHDRGGRRALPRRQLLPRLPPDDRRPARRARAASPPAPRVAGFRFACAAPSGDLTARRAALPAQGRPDGKDHGGRRVAGLGWRTCRATPRSSSSSTRCSPPS